MPTSKSPSSEPSRQEAIAELARIKNVGEFRAAQIYEVLHARTIEELAELAERGELSASISGIGSSTEAKILASAKRHLEKAAPRTPAPSKTERPLHQPEVLVASAAEEVGPVEHVETEAAEVLIAKARAASAGETSEEEEPSPHALDDLKTPQLQDVLVCPNCGNDSFVTEPAAGITCCACRREYTERLGVIDLMPPYRQAHSASQRVMESRLSARFYEDVVRPRLTALVTSRTMREEYAMSADLLSLQDAERLLDVGCGTGNFTRYFARRLDAMRAESDPATVLVVGLDLSMPMLEVARQSIAREQIAQPIYLIRGDAERLPFNRSVFDRVHCAGALHLMADPDEALRNFARSLKPEGLLVLGTFIKGDSWLRRVLKRALEVPLKFHWFDLDDLRDRVRYAGFEVLATEREGDAVTIQARRV